MPNSNSVFVQPYSLWNDAITAGAAEGKEKWGQTHTHGERGSASL